MSLRYSQTLVPTSTDYVSSAVHVQAFLASMFEQGVMGPDDRKLVLITPSSKTREFVNPFTRKVEVHRMVDHKKLFEIEEIGGAIGTLEDYTMRVSGMGRPKHPPLPVDIHDPYHVGVACRRSSELRSLSDLHEESGSTRKVPFYGDPCIDPPESGFFSNPHTLDVIEVPRAGCASFWIEFDLGNNLFPIFDRNDLQLLDPVIVAEAERIFDVRFVQGCNWG